MAPVNSSNFQIRNVTRMVARFHAYQLTEKSPVIRNDVGNYHISGAGDQRFQKYWTMLAALNPGKEVASALTIALHLAVFGPLTEKLRPLCTPSFAQYALIDGPKALGRY
jgi:hypothetical protein